MLSGVYVNKPKDLVTCIFPCWGSSIIVNIRSSTKRFSDSSILPSLPANDSKSSITSLNLSGVEKATSL